MARFLKKHRGMIIVVLIFAAVLSVATFTDLQISHAIADLERGEYYSKNFFAVLFEIIGETPVYILPSIALWIIFRYVKHFSTWKPVVNVLIYAVVIIGVLGLNYFGSHKVVKYIATHTKLFDSKTVKLICEMAFTVAFSLLWLFIASRFKKKNLKSLAICSLIVLFTMGLSQLLVQIVVKPLFGRARYRLMNIKGIFKEYTPWYVMNGKREVSAELLALGAAEDGYKSFPSGHTAAAALVLSLLSLIEYFEMKRGAKITLYVLAVGYTLTVALSRIIMGAHYLSDVTVGAFLTVISFWIARKVVPFLIKKLSKKEADSAGV